MYLFQTESDSSELNLAREKCAKMESNYKVSDERCKKLQEELMETKGEVAKYKFVFPAFLYISDNDLLLPFDNSVETNVSL